MCDTYICLGSASKNNNVIFGKNSDRLGSETQLLTYAPRKTHANGEQLKCTFISIPQVSETAAVLLSQPYWMWGAEMGVNEYDVVIGNEAVATKEPLSETGLLGMDILRLGLERGKTAKEALEVMIDLLEKHGQGGAHNKKGLNYHNTMIIADSKEAYVLETAGKWWIVEIVKDFRSISNNLSIRGKGDLRKQGIVQHAIEKGYCKDSNDFDFALNFSASPLPDKFPPNSRDGCSMLQLNNNKGNITPSMMMTFLREHDVGICMHGRNNQSVGSQVSELKKDGRKSIHWFTGSTIPCLSIFKPHVFPVESQRVLKPGPYVDINPDWFWSQHAEFIKPFKRNPKKENAERLEYYKGLRDIEKGLLERIDDLNLNESNMTEEEFLNEVKIINLDAWNKSLEKIK
ncbi:MAG: C69 family dipeptidase [Promethearchaeota archaeon]